MSTPTFEAIVRLLDETETPYRHVHHEPTRTSEESARVRGEDVRIGGKALLIKTNEVFRLFVMSAVLKLDSSAIKKHFKVRKIRFATADELLEQSGLVPGSVPPFGRPILPYELFIDPTIHTNEKIAFNAGSLTDSIIMTVPHYLKLANPTELAFTKPPLPDSPTSMDPHS